MPKTNLQKNFEAKEAESAKEKIKDEVASQVDVTLTKKQEDKKEELVEEVNSIEDKDIKEDEEKEALKARIQDLEAMMLKVMSSNMPTQQNSDDDSVYISNNSVGMINFVMDRLGNHQFYINAEEKNRPVLKSDVRDAIQLNSIRRMFEYGILEFVDEENYKKFGLIKKFDMSTDKVLEIFSNENIGKEFPELKKLCDGSKMLKHELCYKCLDLMSKGLISQDTMNTVNMYLNKIFCEGYSVQFNDLLSGLRYKKSNKNQV